jgi:serine/threonine protein kinase
MKFLGFNKYEDLNYYTFANKPNFVISKDPKLKFKNNFQYAIIQFNISMLLQWIYYLYAKQKKKVPNNIIIIEDIIKPKIEKYKKFYIESFGNTNFKIFSKSSILMEDFLSYMNEYFVGVYGMNYLRKYIPNFGFYYHMEKNPKSIKVFQEYIPYKYYKDFLQQKYQLIYLSSMGEDFLSIILQIICSLECAQNMLQFTHYDLHHENVLLRENDTNYNFSIPIFDYNMEFENSKYIATITDFGFSTIRLNHQNIISNCYGFPEYGYLSFFNSSVDMTRLLLTTYDICNNLYHNTKKVFYVKIIDFCNFIFKHFYNFNMKEFNDKKSILRKYFFNFTGFPQTYKTPFDLLTFIIKNKSHICNIFEIDNLPIKIKKEKLQLAKLSQKNSQIVSNILCISELEKIKDERLHNFYKNNYKDIFNLKEFKNKVKKTKILSKKLPLLNELNNLEISNFVTVHKWFMNDYEKLYYQYYVKNREQVKNIAQYNRLYKNMTTMEQYIAFLQYKQTNVKQLSSIYKYENKVKSIFI